TLKRFLAPDLVFILGILLSLTAPPAKRRRRSLRRSRYDFPCLIAFEHDLFRKPVSTFRDHALEHFAAATAALDQPGGGRAGYDRGDPNLQIFGAVIEAGSGAEDPRRGILHR